MEKCNFLKDYPVCFIIINIENERGNILTISVFLFWQPYFSNSVPRGALQYLEKLVSIFSAV